MPGIATGIRTRVSKGSEIEQPLWGRSSTRMAGLLNVLALGLLVQGSILISAPAVQASGDPVEDFIDREMPASGVPGLSYAVVTDGEISLVGERGVAEAGGDREVTPDTPFMSGSITKSFTALAVMQLVEAGHVDLDADTSRYLDDFGDRPAGAITIRQLLSHTSGFSTLQGNSSHVDETGAEDELEQRVDQLAAEAPAYEPGQRWEYSNANYLILGRLIEIVSGQDYQTYIATSILEPLGMEDSFVADGQEHESMATGHTPWFGTKRAVADRVTSRGMAPAGGVIASAEDLARYLQTMMNGADDVLSAEGKAQMMRPASPASPFYGLGWFVDSAEGSVWHSGSTPGFESLATMYPAENSGVVVLVNGGSGVGFGETTQLRNGITAAALGLDYDGEGGRWAQKALFIGLALLPVGYLLSMIWAWRHRTQLRAKSGAFGLFSLWFPLLTTLVAAWVVLSLVPRLMGAPLSTVRVFQPDMGAVLIATAVTGVAWAGFRLLVAYTGRSARPSPA